MRAGLENKKSSWSGLSEILTEFNRVKTYIMLLKILLLNNLVRV